MVGVKLSDKTTGWLPLTRRPSCGWQLQVVVLPQLVFTSQVGRAGSEAIEDFKVVGVELKVWAHWTSLT